MRFTFPLSRSLRIIRHPVGPGRHIRRPESNRLVADDMRKSWLFIAGLLSLSLSGGCASVATPDWCHAGTVPAQQARALRYDPYPESELGGSMLGARPRDYEKPPPEPTRGRRFFGKWGQ